MRFAGPRCRIFQLVVVKPMDAWISHEALSWHAYIESWTLIDQDTVQRPYQHWEHAETLLKSELSEFHRIDLIATLKRAIDIRIRNLNEIYDFRKTSLFKRSTPVIDILERLGIVRPLMLSKLIQIRNQVEHQDRPPPNNVVCAELVEFTWYFLRSTDIYVHGIPTGVVLESEPYARHSPYGMTLNTGPERAWSIEILGWLPKTWVTTNALEGWMHVSCERFEPAAEFFTRSPEAQEHHKGRDRSDVWVMGNILGPEDSRKIVVEKYFASMAYALF